MDSSGNHKFIAGYGGTVEIDGDGVAAGIGGGLGQIQLAQLVVSVKEQIIPVDGALGDGWTDVFRGQGGEGKTVELVNTATSGYDVQFRILSMEAKVLSGPETVVSGYSWSVECPTVPFVVQARAADGMKREYTLAYGADKPLEVCTPSENLDK